MGKGDKRTRRGKIFAGSYGNQRSHTAVSAALPKAPVVRKPAAAAPVARKAAAKKA